MKKLLISARSVIFAAVAILLTSGSEQVRAEEAKPNSVAHTITVIDNGLWLDGEPTEMETLVDAIAKGVSPEKREHIKVRIRASADTKVARVIRVLELLETANIENFTLSVLNRAQQDEIESDEQAEYSNLIESKVLREAFAHLLADAVVAARANGGQAPEGFTEPQFVVQQMEALRGRGADFLRVTPEQEEQFERGEFDCEAAQKRIAKSLEVLADASQELDWFTTYVAKQARTKKWKEAKLEAAAQILEAKGAEAQKEK